MSSNRLILALLTVFCFSTVSAFGEDPALSGLVEYQGKKASATQLIVKFKAIPAARANPAALDNVLQGAGLKLGKQDFRTLPKLKILEVSNDLTAAQQRQAGIKPIPNKQGQKPAFANAKALEKAIKRLQASGLFEYVEPDWQVQALQTPSDAALSDGRLWGLRNSGQSGGTADIDVDADNAWTNTLGDSSVIVGVIDSGVRYTHQDLAANMWVNPGEIPGNGIDDDNNGFIDDIHGINAINRSGDPNDDNDHGTHVAGTIAATANDGNPHVGVAPGCRIMALKFLSAGGSGSTSDAIICVDYATMMGAQITNNSWGGGGFSQALLDAVRAANEADSLFVAAAGNASQNNDSSPSFPANLTADNVISVAAIDRSGNLAGFSNFGAETVDIAAPGVSIFSCVASSDSAYSSFNGTSMASPHVAGVAALTLSQHPGISVSELKQRILLGAVPLNSLSGRVATGGRVDAQESIDLGEDGVLELRASSLGPVENASPASFTIAVTDLSPVLNATVSVEHPSGNFVNFLDNGIAPDARAGDGFYSGTLTLGSEPLSNFSFTATVSAPGKQTRQQSFEFPVISPPVNDDFADRLVCQPGTTQTTGNNQFASIEANEPRNPSVAGPFTIWWEWTAPETTNATISTAGSAVDTTLAIYRGTSLTNLVLEGANDDSNGLQSSVSFAATAGTTYFIQVSGYSNITGAINLNYPPPATSSSNGAPFFTTQPPPNVSIIAGSTLTLQAEAGGTGPIDFQWFVDGIEIPNATSATLTIANTTIGNSGRYTVTATNSIGSASSQASDVRVEPVGVLPGNDDFADAVELPFFNGSFNANNSRATAETGEPNHGNISVPINSLWWCWTAPFDGSITVDTFGSNFDTTLAAYQGNSVGALSLISFNDDANNNTRSTLTIKAIEGQKFFFAVDGFGSATGEIVLNYQAALTSTNEGADQFAQRTDLGSELSISVDGGSNRNATGEIGEPSHAGSSAPLQSLWWTWTAPSNGLLNLSTFGSNFDTTLAAYVGNSLSSLNLQASNDDSNGLLSSVNFPVTAGTSYQIAIDGFSNASGDVRLILDFTPNVVLTPRQRFDTEVSDAGLIGPDLDPTAQPFSDGISNLIKYAFNLTLSERDRSSLEISNLSDNSGLPVFEVVEGSNNELHLRVTYLQRPSNGLIYTPLMSQDLANPRPMNASRAILNLADGWQRVQIEERLGNPDLPVFGHFQVSFP